MNYEELEKIEKGKPKLSEKHLKTVQSIEKKIRILRKQLYELRPVLPSFKRDHTFQEFNNVTGKWEWKTVCGLVSLRQFNFAPGIEGEAFDIGEKIEKLKEKIFNIVITHKSESRRQMQARL